MVRSIIPIFATGLFALCNLVSCDETTRFLNKGFSRQEIERKTKEGRIYIFGDYAMGDVMQGSNLNSFYQRGYEGFLDEKGRTYYAPTNHQCRRLDLSWLGRHIAYSLQNTNNPSSR